MTYTLDAFVKDAKSALEATNGPAGREKVRVLLEKLLGNKAVRRRGGRPRGADRHAQALRGQGPGLRRAGALQSQAAQKPAARPWQLVGGLWPGVKYTDMSEYRRLDGGNGAGEARLEQVKSYRLEPGHAGVYDVGAIHAIDYPEGSRFVRVTGRDLDYVQRLKFDTAAGKAITIESATAG